MPHTSGRHRISRRTKIATGAIGLAIAVGALAVVTTVGDPGNANADEADPALYIDILKVKPNNRQPSNGRNASFGTFTVDCGRNENKHFNPDNFIAQPGIRNGAQHLHDYVGNLSSNADSNNKSLLKAGTTCRNGDKSAYFWPVVRIDTGEAEKNEQAQSADGDRAKSDQDAKSGQVDCPDVASKLDDVPDQAMAEVDQNLDQLDTQIDEANKRIEATKGQGGQNFVQNAILGPLKDKRKATIDRIAIAIGRHAAKPQGLDQFAPCALKPQPAPKPPATLPGPDGNNELPGNDGEIQRPQKAQITFRGSPVTKVVAMPKFLRILYGDAKVRPTARPTPARAGRVPASRTGSPTSTRSARWTARSSGSTRSRAAGTARTPTVPTTARTSCSPTRTAAAPRASARCRSCRSR